MILDQKNYMFFFIQLYVLARPSFHFVFAFHLSNFLTDYLKQINTFGYSKAPLEIDAQKHEQH